MIYLSRKIWRARVLSINIILGVILAETSAISQEVLQDKSYLHSTDIGLSLGHSSRIKSVVFSPAGDVLISAGEYDAIKFWDVQTGDWIKTLIAPNGAGVLAMALSPDGKILASRNSDQTVKLWDVQTGKMKIELAIPLDNSETVAFSSDGKMVASGGNIYKGLKAKGGEAKVWDAQSGELKLTLAGHTKQISDVAFSPDSRMIATSGWDAMVKIWDAETGELKLPLKGHKGLVESIAFSPDGKALASGGEDKAVKIWDAETGQLIKTLTGHKERVDCVIFSHNGRYLASSSYWVQKEEGVIGEIKVWDAQSWELKHSLIAHSGLVESVAFAPDDNTLVSGGNEDHAVKIWDVQTGALKLTVAGYDPFEGLNPLLFGGERLRDNDFLLLIQSDQYGGGQQAYSGVTSSKGETSIQVGENLIRKTSPQSTIFISEPNPSGDRGKNAGFWSGLSGKTYHVSFDNTISLGQQGGLFEVKRLNGEVEMRGQVRWDSEGALITGERNFLRVRLDKNEPYQLIINRKKTKNGGLQVTLENGSSFLLHKFSHDFTLEISKN